MHGHPAARAYRHRSLGDLSLDRLLLRCGVLGRAGSRGVGTGLGITGRSGPVVGRITRIRTTGATVRSAGHGPGARLESIPRMSSGIAMLRCADSAQNDKREIIHYKK